MFTAEDVNRKYPDGYQVEDSGCGIVDTACKVSVCGSNWYNDYNSHLKMFGLRHLVVETPEREKYRIGDGGVVRSCVKSKMPHSPMRCGSIY